MVRGQGFDVAGTGRYSVDGSCIHKRFNLAQQLNESVISEGFRSNDVVREFFTLQMRRSQTPPKRGA